MEQIRKRGSIDSISLNFILVPLFMFVVNQQCVVYHFLCDLCDADYVGYTAQRPHQHIAEYKNSAIGRHFLEAHVNKNVLKECQFTVLRKCQGKFECLVFKMLFIKKLSLI